VSDGAYWLAAIVGLAILVYAPARLLGYDAPAGGGDAIAMALSIFAWVAVVAAVVTALWQSK
jgi:hypothetical protein